MKHQHHKYDDAPRMSEATADALISSAAVVEVKAEDDSDWGFDRDVYELGKIVDEIVAALGSSSEFADERYGVCRRRMAAKFVPPVRPDLDFSFPKPDWAEADFSTPAAPPATVL